MPLYVRLMAPSEGIQPFAYAGPQASFEIDCSTVDEDCPDTGRPTTTWSAVVGAGIRLGDADGGGFTLEARYVYGLSDLELAVDAQLAMDWRVNHSHGELDRWEPEDAEEFLVHWCPATVAVDDEGLVGSRQHQAVKGEAVAPRHGRAPHQRPPIVVHAEVDLIEFGARPIVDALNRGAHVVITGRSTDTALTYAPMMHAFGWAHDDVDRIAAGVVAGHINECGAQASGGNSIVAWKQIQDLSDVGYPIIEAYPDGTFVVTKHDGTGGLINRAVVAEQILYEMGDPRTYITPDVVADFTTIHLDDEGPNRVRVHGVRGAKATDMLKVSISYNAGYKAVGTLVYAWPDAVEKARMADRVLRERLDRMDLKFDEVRTELVGWSSTHGHLAGEPPKDLPEIELRIGVRSENKAAVEAFTREIAPLILTGPPSVTGFAGGRPRVQEVVAYWPALIDRTQIEPHLRVEVKDA